MINANIGGVQLETDLVKKAHDLRNTVLEMCIKAGTGHVTSCFSCVEIMVALFYSIMKTADRFILSKGQASPLYYAILADKGLIPGEELWKFAQKDGQLGVHLDHHVNGVLATSGSLGHGLGIASGLALAKKMNNEPGIVYCLLGDGECEEGSVWESAMFAGKHHLDNLVAIVDRNWLSVQQTLDYLEPLEIKWESFGWCSHRKDGYNLKEVTGLYISPENPNVFICDTVKGKGIPFMEGKVEWHGLAPQGEDAERARRELNG